MLFDDSSRRKTPLNSAHKSQVRRQAKQALRQSDDRLRLFVASVQEYALIQTDPEGLIATWNPGAERLFGYAPSEMLGRAFPVC